MCRRCLFTILNGSIMVTFESFSSSLPQSQSTSSLPQSFSIFTPSYSGQIPITVNFSITAHCTYDTHCDTYPPLLTSIHGYTFVLEICCTYLSRKYTIYWRLQPAVIHFRCVPFLFHVLGCSVLS